MNRQKWCNGEASKQTKQYTVATEQHVYQFYQHVHKGSHYEHNTRMKKLQEKEKLRNTKLHPTKQFSKNKTNPKKEAHQKIIKSKPQQLALLTSWSAFRLFPAFRWNCALFRAFSKEFWEFNSCCLVDKDPCCSVEGLLLKAGKVKFHFSFRLKWRLDTTNTC